MTTISYVLAAGIAAELSVFLIKPLSGTARGLVCWTLSALCFVIAGAMLLSDTKGLSPDFELLMPALGGLAAITLIIVLIEVFAPAKRFTRHSKEEYDASEAERSLNLVFVIITAALAAAGAAASFCGSLYLLICGILPAAAISIRQLSFYLYRAKTDARPSRSGARKKQELLKTLQSQSRKL